MAARSANVGLHLDAGGMVKVLTPHRLVGSTRDVFYGCHSAFTETSHTCHGASECQHQYSRDAEYQTVRVR